MFSDLLPTSMAKAWWMVCRALMLGAALAFITFVSNGNNRSSAHAAAQPTPPAVELMHDLIQPPIVSSQTRVVWMEVTAYCACPKCCGPHAAGITASGKQVSYNAGRFIAADTSVLPFGTKVIIPGYGNEPVEVVDRGSAIKGNHIDVFFDSHDQAMHWGRQRLPVTIVE